MRNSFSHIRPFSKLALVALIALFSLLVSIIVSSVLAIPFFGPGVFKELMHSGINFDAESLPLLKYFQLSQSIGLFVIPSFLLAFLLGGSVIQYLKLGSFPKFGNLLLSLLIVVIASPFINFIADLNSKMILPEDLSWLENWMKTSEESASNLTKLFLKTETVYGLLFNILLIGIIPALGEELLFRGIIQRIFHEWTKNKHLAIWISAFLFSFLHFQFYGFIPRALLGALFGYLFVFSGNLWIPIFAHFVNNAFAVLAYFLYDKGVSNVDPDALGVENEHKYIVITSLVLVVLFFWLFYRNTKKERSKIETSLNRD
jgi:uncharacterized protein